MTRLAWGTAFLLDAGARVLMAYTLPVDSAPLLGVVLLIAALVIAQGASMLFGRRSGQSLKRVSAATGIEWAPPP